MPCFHPMTGYRSRFVNPKTGKRSLVFSLAEGFKDMPVTISCNQCLGCRLKRSRDWAVRCVHESQLYLDNSFITLTYNNFHLPDFNSLVKEDFQKFMKRLRKRFGEGIRYYACGEYGEKFQRPHYHACIFNWRPPDPQPFKVINGYTSYTSEVLQELWTDSNGPIGFVSFGDLTFESAAYVARYVTKKITGEAQDFAYEVIKPSDGEVLGKRVPEFSLMSRRPGLGAGWLDKYPTDPYPSDFVVINGRKMRPPKYYDNRFELDFPEVFAEVKAERKRDAAIAAELLTPDQLAVKEKVQTKKFKLLKRGYESDL